jgi:hypothetical protein
VRIHLGSPQWEVLRSLPMLAWRLIWLRVNIKSLILVSVAASIAVAQTSGPFVQGAIYLVNTATRRTPQTADAGLAPGSLCDINILGLYHPSGNLEAGDVVTLSFRAPGASSASDLKILVSQNSYDGTPVYFTALVPLGIPPGQAEVVATAASGKSFSTTVWIAESGVGIFTKASAGYDAAVAQVWRNGPVTVGLTNPVRAGEWVTLWGTGLGSAAAVTVSVGGFEVSPAYAGPSPDYPGVDQINIIFPEGMPDDCYIPITVKAGGRTGNTPSIPAASAPGACRHRLGLSAEALATLDGNGLVPLSQTWVHGDVLPSFDNPGLFSRYDTVSLDFIQYDAAGVQVVTGQLTAPTAGCQLNLVGSSVGGIFLNVQEPLDAGRPVVTGPAGERIPMDGDYGHYATVLSSDTYTIDAIPPSSFAPGVWAVEVPGGKDIGAFQAGLRVPPPLRWTNRAAVSPVSRSSDLVLKWDPTGYTEREWMQASLGVGMDYVACQGPASTGSLTIPASLISQLPTGATATPMVQLLLTPVNSTPRPGRLLQFLPGDPGVRQCCGAFCRHWATSSAGVTGPRVAGQRVATGRLWTMREWRAVDATFSRPIAHETVP